MKLIELNPCFLGAGGYSVSNADGSPVPERHGVGLSFDCPCGCGTRGYIDFENPLDGGPPHDTRPSLPRWQRTGETLETLTLTPSILRSQERGGCGWHGFITNGEVRTV